MRSVDVGGLKIGGGRVLVQSMISGKIERREEILEEISSLKDLGLDIIRLAVPKISDVADFAKIAEKSPVPVVADIHFDHKIAVAVAECGASKIRINPGNIGGEENIKRVIDACKNAHIPIRVGANLGSLEKNAQSEFGRTPEAIVASAFENVKLLEKHGFYDIVVSLKASDASATIKANRLFRALYPEYPLHVGVTESGTTEMGVVKSAIGIGSLLCDGIGETIRVSLTADNREEVLFAHKILRGCGLEDYIEVVSCPTCGRCEYDVESVAREVAKKTAGIIPKRHLKIAVMGCVVNGVGEGKDADVGIACGVDKFVIFANGKVHKTIKREEMGEFFALVEKKIEEMK